MGIRVGKIAPLVFFSGLCALIYQVAWMREFREVFGASTAASAAVVAIFIGGLGLGGLVLGKRVDRHERPLTFYSWLEIGIALSVAATPGLVWLTRAIYFQLGGSETLGLGLATVVRLLLSAMVLLPPTFLMGGTLPALARAVETESDKGRRKLGLLYGVNTLGAVAGCMLSNFLLLEVVGTKRTLWVACLINLLVGILARGMARKTSPVEEQPAEGEATREASAPAGFVLAAAATVGFGFFLMELVWYRMLSPLLGGTVFTFGLVLAVALLGIGIGGALYSFAGQKRPATLLGFSATCLLEAACLGIPFALGDQVAIEALLLRPLGATGFGGSVFGWTMISSLVVFPAALVAGYQFPLLIALLGQGRENVGRQVGLTYAWNTVGAIGGSLAGGFGLLPLLTAPGCWRAVTVLFGCLGLGALALHGVQRKLRWSFAWPVLVAAIAAACVFAGGPTAVWRHSPIGAGRVNLDVALSPNSLRAWMNAQRESVAWEVDGVESSVALNNGDSLSFFMNGKSDGNAVHDASTQIMSGMLGAFLRPGVRQAMVIGLGTGSTAGWLGMIPEIERVDVVELEPAILEVARACSTVNRDVLSNPKVRIAIGDAREVLQTTRESYDLIFSEPSNPFRAGIASLFTAEYYQSIAERLREGGIFVQWVQGYEVDSHTVRTIYATLASVFPEVETWHTGILDLLLVASSKPIEYDVERLRQRMKEEPFREALANVWHTQELENVLARFVARTTLARDIARIEGEWLNTDDQNLLEFGFARSLGEQRGFIVSSLLETSRARGEDRPKVNNGEVDWLRVEEHLHRIFNQSGHYEAVARFSKLEGDSLARNNAARSFQAGRTREALKYWRSQSQEPKDSLELLVLAIGLADAGDEGAREFAEKLREFEPAEAPVVLASLEFQKGRFQEAAGHLESAFLGFRGDPWPRQMVIRGALDLAKKLATKEPVLVGRMLAALEKPFSTFMLNRERLFALAAIAERLGDEKGCTAWLEQLGPVMPWSLDFLIFRNKCFATWNHPLAAKAKADLEEFVDNQPFPFATGLLQTPGDPSSQSQ